MVNLSVLATKLAELAARVDRVRLHRKATPEALSADRDALDLVSFNLMLAVQTCADIQGLADLDAFARELASWSRSAP